MFRIFGVSTLIAVAMTCSANIATAQGLVEYALILVYNGPTTGAITTRSIPYYGRDGEECQAETDIIVYDDIGAVLMHTKTRGSTASSALPAEFGGDYYPVSIRHRSSAGCRPTTSSDVSGALPLGHTQTLIKDRFRGSGRLYVGPIRFDEDEDLTLARVVEGENKACMEALRTSNSAITVRDAENRIVDRMTVEEGHVIETASHNILVNHLERAADRPLFENAEAGGYTFEFPPFCGYSTMSIGQRGAILIAGH